MANIVANVLFVLYLAALCLCHYEGDYFDDLPVQRREFVRDKCAYGHKGRCDERGQCPKAYKCTPFEGGVKICCRDENSLNGKCEKQKPPVCPIKSITACLEDRDCKDPSKKCCDNGCGGTSCEFVGTEPERKWE